MLGFLRFILFCMSILMLVGACWPELPTFCRLLFVVGAVDLLWTIRLPPETV